MKPPRAGKRQHSDTRHGITRHDGYAWLRAANWQEVMHDPSALPADIRDYLDAENRYYEQQMADTTALQAQIFGELKGRIKEDDSSVPAPEGDWAYYSKYDTGAQHPRYCRRARDLSGSEIVMLDGNTEGAGKAFFRIGGLSLSPDHTRVAWSFDDKGSEFHRILVRDLATGKEIGDQIDNTGGSAVWSADGTSFFYVLQDDNHRPLKIFKHRLGTAQSDDTLVYHETDTAFFAGVGKTSSERFIVINSHDHESSEAWLLDAHNPDAPARIVASRRPEFEYDVEHHGDRLIIRTNAGGAEDYKIVTAPLDAPSPENWVDLVPHRSGCLVLAVGVFKDWMIRLEREDGLPRIVIHEWATGEEHRIAFDEEAYSLGFGEMREYATDTLRFSYSSMTTPGQVYDYDMRRRTRVLRKTQIVPSGHDPANYVTRRIQAPAHDGELIPVTLLYRKSTPLDGSAPLWLYGYGSYGITIPASFNTNILSLADRGFVYAIAHVRGGQDKGYRWYKQGKREKKMNSFRDFISAAEHLIAEQFTSKANIIAQGGSAGGLLVGAVANMAPELFKGIIAEVPFVDCINTILDETLPLTPPEWQEWGNPIESKAAYETIAAYSPYDRIEARAYPHMLAVAGLTDPRVTYWEPAKWVAKLRELKTGDNMLLFKTNMEAGHAGASGRFDRLKEVAFVYAFGLKVSGKL